MSRGGFEAVSISVAGGVSGVVDGTANNREMSVDRATMTVKEFTLPETAVETFVTVDFDEDDAKRVAKLAMDLEEQLSIGPLDIEFALDSLGRIFLLQARSDVAFPWKLRKEGDWALQGEMVCVPRGPMAGLCQQPVLEGLAEGYEILSSRCFAPVHFHFQVVNGFVYKKHAKFNLGSVWPSLMTVGSFISEKAWEQDVDDWLKTVQPELQARVDRLAGVQLVDLEDKELEKYIDDCICLLKQGTIAHRRFSTAAVMPLLDLFEFVRAQNPSFGQREKKQLILAIEQDQKKTLRAKRLSHSGQWVQEFLKALEPHQRKLLGEGEILQKVEHLAKNDGQAGEAARRLLRGAQTWTFGPDVMSPTAWEERDVLSHELEKGLRDFDKQELNQQCVQNSSAGVMSLVPPKKQKEMRRLLDMAIAASPIREDRFSIHHQVVALLRMALLEAGARSVKKGVLKSKEDMLATSSLQEVDSLLRGDSRDIATGVSNAYQWLRTALRAELKAPDRLPLRKIPAAKSASSSGWMPTLLKACAWMPRLSWVIALQMWSDWQELDHGPAPEVVQPTAEHHGGFRGISVDEMRGVVQGHARVGVDGLQAGEILVVKETSVSYVKHFAVLGGLVRDIVQSECH